MVGDNDFMFHRVERVGPEGVKLLAGMSLDSTLEAVSESDWAVFDGGRELIRLPYADIRISVSWKAQIFEDEAEMQCVDKHLDDLCIDEVWRGFYSDLEARGIEIAASSDPLRDAALVSQLSAVYQLKPSTQPEMR